MSRKGKKEELDALDETVVKVKANKKRYFDYSTVDVERNKLILMSLHDEKLACNEILQRSA